MGKLLIIINHSKCKTLSLETSQKNLYISNIFHLLEYRYLLQKKKYLLKISDIQNLEQ